MTDASRVDRVGERVGRGELGRDRRQERVLLGGDRLGVDELVEGVIDGDAREVDRQLARIGRLVGLDEHGVLPVLAAECGGAHVVGVGRHPEHLAVGGHVALEQAGLVEARVRALRSDERVPQGVGVVGVGGLVGVFDPHPVELPDERGREALVGRLDDVVAVSGLPPRVVVAGEPELAHDHGFRGDVVATVRDLGAQAVIGAAVHVEAVGVEDVVDPVLHELGPRHGVPLLGAPDVDQVASAVDDELVVHGGDHVGVVVGLAAGRLEVPVSIGLVVEGQVLDVRVTTLLDELMQQHRCAVGEVLQVGGRGDVRGHAGNREPVLDVAADLPAVVQLDLGTGGFEAVQVGVESLHLLGLEVEYPLLGLEPVGLEPEARNLGLECLDALEIHLPVRLVVALRPVVRHEHDRDEVDADAVEVVVHDGRRVDRHGVLVGGAGRGHRCREQRSHREQCDGDRGDHAADGCGHGCTGGAHRRVPLNVERW